MRVKEPPEHVQGAQVLEILKGLAFTFRQIFQKPATIQYPEEQAELPPSFRGRPVLVQRADGREKCVACGLCELVCPPIAIQLQGAEVDDELERYPITFRIDMLRCIMCGYCEEVCPEEAIVMSDEAYWADFSREAFILDKDKLLVPEERLERRLQFIRTQSNQKWVGTSGGDGGAGEAV